MAMTTGIADHYQEMEFLFGCVADPISPESGQAILPRLLNLIPPGHHPAIYVESLRDPMLRAHIRENSLHLLNELKLLHDLKFYLQAANRGSLDLEMGAFLISRFKEDMLTGPEEISLQLDRLAIPLRERLRTIDPDDGPLRLAIFRQYLFEEAGFSGNSRNYYSPENSYITSVLESRKGIPVTLSVIAVLIGQRVGLNISGVSLPGHFIARFKHGNYETYLDPFHQGSIMTQEEVSTFLQRQGLKVEPEYFRVAPTLAILKRMYRNLINYFSARGNVKMEKMIRHHFNILENYSIRS